MEKDGWDYREVLDDVTEIIETRALTDRLGRGKWLTKLEEYAARRFIHHYAVAYGGGTIRLVKLVIEMNDLDVSITGYWSVPELPCWFIFTEDRRSRDILKQIRQHAYGEEPYSHDFVALGVRPSEITACTTYHRLKSEDGKKRGAL